MNQKERKLRSALLDLADKPNHKQINQLLNSLREFYRLEIIDKIDYFSTNIRDIISNGEDLDNYLVFVHKDDIDGG